MIPIPFLSEGNGEAARIRGNRVRDLNKIQSEAYRQGEEIRGVADAKATEIYATAYNQSPEAVAFYEFTRTRVLVEAGQPVVGEPVPDAVAVGFRQRLVASLVRVVDEPEMQFEAVDLPFHRGVAEAAVVIAELDERGVDRPARQVETSAPEDAAFSFPFEQHCPDSLVYPFRQLTHIDLQHLAASHVEFGDVAMASIRSQMFKDHWHHNWNY